MKTETTRVAVCPLCGETYTGVPALSREDNQTSICPDCGARQALLAAGDLFCRLVSHLRVKLHFARHEPTSLQKNKPAGRSNRLCMIQFYACFSPTNWNYFNIRDRGKKHVVSWDYLRFYRSFF